MPGILGWNFSELHLGYGVTVPIAQENLYEKEGFQIAYYAFLIGEHSRENLDFLREMCKFQDTVEKDSLAPAKIKEELGKFINRFIIQGAPDQVNIRSEVYNSIINAFKSLGPNPTMSEISAIPIQAALDEITHLIQRDGLPRFLKSDDFKRTPEGKEFAKAKRKADKKEDEVKKAAEKAKKEADEAAALQAAKAAKENNIKAILMQISDLNNVIKDMKVDPDTTLYKTMESLIKHLQQIYAMCIKENTLAGQLKLAEHIRDIAPRHAQIVTDIMQKEPPKPVVPARLSKSGSSNNEPISRAVSFSTTNPATPSAEKTNTVLAVNLETPPPQRPTRMKKT